MGFMYSLPNKEGVSFREQIRRGQEMQALQRQPKKSLQVPEQTYQATTKAPVQKQGRVPTVNRQKKSRGKTILDPLAVKDEGSTYRKKLLGD